MGDRPMGDRPPRREEGGDFSARPGDSRRRPSFGRDE
jgi:hypothetical protein